MRGDMQTPPYTEIVEGFWDEPEDSLDAVFVGSSHVYCDVNPLYLWKNYGITSYDFSMTTQTIDCSYYYIQEIFKRQTPKFVFYETWLYNRPFDMEESHHRSAYDYMPNTVEKWETLRTLLQKQPAENKEDAASYLFPIIRYHSRIFSLEKNDFEHLFSDKHNEMHGFYPRRYSCSGIDSYYTSTGTTIVPNDIFLGYLSKMKELCEKNGSELVLLTSLVPYWTVEDHQAISLVASEMGLDYLDLNPIADDVVGIDVDKDFSDTNHLNVYGADKETKYIGDYLREKQELVDHRSDAEYGRWNEDYQYYLDYLETLPTEL